MKRFHRRTSRGTRRQADLFFADLVGEPPADWSRRHARTVAGPEWRHAPSAVPPVYPAASPVLPLPAPLQDDEFAEAVPLRGRGGFRHEPLGGIAVDNVAARWNADAATPSGSPIDIVVHLHGYSELDDDANFLPA